MKSQGNSRCGQCEILAAKVAALEKDLARLREELAAGKKNSSTSSKPPSSDIVKPKPAGNLPEGQKRSIGGQPGHPMHAREPFPHEQVTFFQVHSPDACPDCGGVLRRNGSVEKVVQQVDVQAGPLSIEQHTCPEYICNHCGHHCKAPLPLHIEKGGLIGPDLTALIAFMKGGCHASFSTIRKFLRDIVGVQIARSTLSKIINKVSQALDGPYEELLHLLPSEGMLNIDETGHKDNGKRWWTWCLVADLYTFFKIDRQRSAGVLMELLGFDFDGVIGCDYFSAYRRYMRVCGVEVQFCLAHLIRDVKFLTTLPDTATKAYGERLRLALKQMFAVIHRREEMSAAAFDQELATARDHVLKAGLNEVPSSRPAQNMAKRFREHGEAFFTFITTPGVEPTNNLAEQAIRFVVIDRHITMGTRSEAGRKWSERIWTVIATCARHSRSAYAYLKEAVASWFKNEPAPSLLPQGATA
jgi:transposase